MEFLKTLTLGLRRGGVTDRSGLAAAIGSGAAYLAQGSGFSYIRARSGTMGPRLMQDEGFGAGMERCKWEGFAAAAGDLILLAESELRPLVRTGAAVWLALYCEVLAAQPMPPHRRDWDDRIAAFERRLTAHLAADPAGIEAISQHSAEVILQFAPVDDTIRAMDREMVTNNVKFRFIDHFDGLRQRTDWPALAADISAAEGAAG
ncbi:MAG TPA: esterase [Thermohalobaculum sp.]|nr:esterase [Thermohalobaculum sp.]